MDIGRQKMAKLKNILQEVFEESPQVDKYKVVEGVKNFGIVGKQLYNNNNIVETAKQLAEIAESAHHHILGESDDWFDKVSVNKNMKSLKGSVVEFTKTAKEAQALNQRMTALYEDIGHVLNRYYDIDEALDKVDPSKVEPEDDFEDREDKDIDNDGDTDDSDEYLKKRRDAVTKAVKNESEEETGAEVEPFEDTPTITIKEGISFDKNKMLKTIKKDKFLKYVVKKDFRGKVTETVLEQLYWQYIKGDKQMEKVYKKA